MSIRITNQPALIGLDITFPETTLEQRMPRMLMSQERQAKFELKVDVGQVVVDNKPALQSIGYYDPVILARRFSQRGLQEGLTGIKRRVQEGFEMSDIHQNGFVLGKIGRREAWERYLQVEVDCKKPAEVSYQPGYLEMDWTIRNNRYTTVLGEVESNFDWGKINLYLRQKDYIKIDWIGNRLDLVC